MHTEITTCVPCVPQSNRKILSIINTDTSQMSLFNHSQTVRARDMHHLPEEHRNCSCKTFWSTCLVLLFERACCLYVPLHFTIRQCPVCRIFNYKPRKESKIHFSLHKGHTDCFSQRVEPSKEAGRRPQTAGCTF